MKKCTAYNHKCTKCGILHHYENVCRQSLRKQHQPAPLTVPLPGDDATAIFDSLCSVSDIPTHSAHAITLQHHVYNEFCDAWEKRASDPQPFIDVSIKAVPSDARTLGFPTSILSPTPAVSYPAMANTGCQSCLAGTKLLPKLGLSRHHLLPVTMKMTAADNRSINIAGAIVLRISGTSPSKETIETRQIVYFTDSSGLLLIGMFTSFTAIVHCIWPAAYC